jgi:hypothetical protein
MLKAAAFGIKITEAADEKTVQATNIRVVAL